jgi:hypothetical protein
MVVLGAANTKLSFFWVETLANFKEIKKGKHQEAGSEYTSIKGLNGEQLAFVQRYGKEWGAWLDKLSPTNYVWFLGNRKTRKEAEAIMLSVVRDCKEP